MISSVEFPFSPLVFLKTVILIFILDEVSPISFEICTAFFMVILDFTTNFTQVYFLKNLGNLSIL